MFSAKNLLSTAFAASLILTASVDAQSLDGQVVRNPDDTVTYTIDVDGPPRGTFILLISPLLNPSPFQIPGFFNPLFIDPGPMFIGPQLPVDQSGHGHFQITVPAVSIPTIPLYFQAVVINPLIQVRLSANYLALDGSD